jgi:hypothetical protein
MRCFVRWVRFSFGIGRIASPIGSKQTLAATTGSPTKPGNFLATPAQSSPNKPFSDTQPPSAQRNDLGRGLEFAVSAQDVAVMVLSCIEESNDAGGHFGSSLDEERDHEYGCDE